MLQVNPAAMAAVETHLELRSIQLVPLGGNRWAAAAQALYEGDFAMDGLAVMGQPSPVELAEIERAMQDPALMGLRDERLEVSPGVGDVGGRKETPERSPLALDYDHRPLGSVEPRTTTGAPFDMGAVETKLALHVVFYLRNAMDQGVSAQLYGAGNPDSTHFAVGSPVSIAAESGAEALIPPLEELWHPYTGVEITPLEAPSLGSVSGDAHMQRWYPPERMRLPFVRRLRP